MCIFFNMYDTLEPFRDAKLKIEEKIGTFLLYSYFFLYSPY